MARALSPLALRAIQEPQGLALADGQRALGWQDLHDEVMRGAAAMAALSPGRVALMASNSVEAVVAHLSALYSGTSLVPINPQLTASEAAWQIADSDAVVVLSGPETVQTAQAAVETAGRGRVVAWGEGLPVGVTPMAVWRDAAPVADDLRQRPAQPFLHYTSGTTGKPKGTETPSVMFPRGLTVQDLLAHLRIGVESGPEGPVLLIGPSYHTGPMTSIRELAGGRPMIVMERFDAEKALALIERHRIAMAVMVPTHFQRLLALPDEVRMGYDVSSLTFVPHTGASCPVPVKRAMIEWFGPVLIEGYGGTECGTTCIITSEEWWQRPGSVGRAVPPFEVMVLDEAGKSLDSGETGRLFFRDTTGRGIEYRNDPEKTRNAHIAPGVFTLGDLGYVDEDGFVFITGRSADMIVSGGVNIYPAEIEHELLLHPLVEDAAVIGVPHEDLGEVAKALIVLREGGHVQPDDVLAFLKGRIAAYKLPRTIEFVRSLGRNAMGKVNKESLRRPYWPSDRTIG